MKKNLLLVITLALVLVNLVLTAILAISIIPETKKANELITKVCSAIDLELKAGDNDASKNVDLSNLETYDIGSDEALTINLKKGEDGEDHFAVIKVTLSINKESEDYETYGGDNLSSYESLMKTQINNIVSQYTYEEIREDQAGVQKEILKKFQELFSEDFIVDVGFSSATYQ